MFQKNNPNYLIADSSGLGHPPKSECAAPHIPVDARRLAWRRVAFAGLVGITVAVMTALLIASFWSNGVTCEIPNC